MSRKKGPWNQAVDKQKAFCGNKNFWWSHQGCGVLLFAYPSIEYQSFML